MLCPLLTLIVTLDGLTLLKLLLSHAKLPQEDFVLKKKTSTDVVMIRLLHMVTKFIHINEFSQFQTFL